ncbi:MAG: DNA gyrase subunit A [Bacteroidetes bacterium CG2_30_33_31]|nr:MAG: DNA gyrase subunit A [Bacteroidetes bacterium CG2_30_33_31]
MNEEKENILDDGDGEDNSRIINVNIDNQMKSAYIDYAMSVIVSRALPDVRDGFKPVHRRVLYGMLDLGVYSNKAYKKSARIVGEVLGKYHPHGDSSVYDAMVRMAQEWSLRYPLVDGQGNFGSIDGDSPAAMRYTEARLKKIAEEMLNDIDKDTVDFQLNFDDSLKEPTVLPTKIPNLLINGASGIAVGMATNMAPHNLSEVIDGCIAYINNNDIEISELIKYIKAPDFPTGAIIYGYDGVREAFETGRGRVVMRGETTFEEGVNGSRDKIIVTSIPYQVNKSELIKRTADLVNEKKIEGIADIRDESDRNGIRIVYELKRESVSNVVLNKLYQFTQLQTSFSINNIALVNGKPKLLNVKELIKYFIEHRHEVITRRTQFELSEAEKRAHILEGLIIASDNIDEVIAIIRASQSPDEAREKLIIRFNLSDIQARAIVEMRLRQLTGLEQDKLRSEYAEIEKLIEHLKAILADVNLRMEIIANELIEIKAKYGDERRSTIEFAAADFKVEDTIPDDDVVISISHLGYIKRTNLSEYRTQNRGGRGARGSSTRNEDFIENIFVATNHNYMLFFTEFGKVYWLRVFEIPEGNKTSKGRAIQNMIDIDPNDKVRAFIPVQNLKDEQYVNNNYVVLCTKNGIIKKTTLEAYSRPRQNGINAITVREGDQLLEARLTNGENNIMIALKSGRAIRFPEEKVRPMGRNASGVKGITLIKDNDEVIGMITVKNDESTILVVSEKGYGKRSSVEDYRITNRGGKGVKTINITDKTGKLIAIKDVNEDNDLMIMNKSGITIRMSVSEMRIMGRATQGTRLIRLQETDEIAAVAKVISFVEEIVEEIISDDINNIIDESTEVEDIKDQNIEDVDIPNDDN